MQIIYTGHKTAMSLVHLSMTDDVDACIAGTPQGQNVATITAYNHHTWWPQWFLGYMKILMYLWQVLCHMLVMEFTDITSTYRS
jgi:hypothetical protein